MRTGLRTKIWRVPRAMRNGNASQRHIKNRQRSVAKSTRGGKGGSHDGFTGPREIIEAQCKAAVLDARAAHAGDMDERGQPQRAGAGGLCGTPATIISKIVARIIGQPGLPARTPRGHGPALRPRYTRLRPARALPDGDV